MHLYNQYILFLIALKVVFILLSIAHIYNRIKRKTNTKEDKQIVYWKDRIEFVFTIGMAILLIYVFSPRRKDHAIVTKETQILFYMFGIVLLLTAKWENFIKTGMWFKDFQMSLQ